MDKGSFTASCLPSTRPDICIPPAWDLLQEKFDGERCLDGPKVGGIGKKHASKNMIPITGGPRIVRKFVPKFLRAI